MLLHAIRIQSQTHSMDGKREKEPSMEQWSWIQLNGKKGMQFEHVWSFIWFHWKHYINESKHIILNLMVHSMKIPLFSFFFFFCPCRISMEICRSKIKLTNAEKFREIPQLLSMLRWENENGYKSKRIRIQLTNKSQCEIILIHTEYKLNCQRQQIKCFR